MSNSALEGNCVILCLVGKGGCSFDKKMKDRRSCDDSKKNRSALLMFAQMHLYLQLHEYYQSRH